MNPERDGERGLDAQMVRAEAEAQRILHAALEQAAVLQVEMSKEVEAQTRRRISMAEREIADRLAEADQQAAERVRQSVDTAASLLLNARKEADRVREELAEAARAEAAELRTPARPGEIEALIDQAQQAAVARVSEADSFAEQRIAETVEWCKRHIAEADQIGTQRLLDAETRAQEIIRQARAEVATLTFASDDAARPEDRPGFDDRAPPPPRAMQGGATSSGDDRAAVAVSSESQRRFPRLVKTTRVVILVVVAVMGTDLLRSCVAQPYTVASTSMEPEFHDGDRLVVNKLAYRLGDAARGDIVVFDTSQVPGETNRLGDTLVKRVIGMPGDVVQAVEGQVLINGEPLDEPWLDETLTPPFGPVEVPEDSLFLLGDDRVLSVDSRTFGPVPSDALVGRVEAVIWPPGDRRTRVVARLGLHRRGHRFQRVSHGRLDRIVVERWRLQRLLVVERTIREVHVPPRPVTACSSDERTICSAKLVCSRAATRRSTSAR